MLDLQQRYFKSRNPSLVGECRGSEAAMRKRCNAILHPPAPSLFGARDSPEVTP